jgi:hypothetical protein
LKDTNNNYPSLAEIYNLRLYGTSINKSWLKQNCTKMCTASGQKNEISTKEKKRHGESSRNRKKKKKKPYLG